MKGRRRPCTRKVRRRGKRGRVKEAENAAPIPLSIVDKTKREDLDLQSGNEADLWPVSQ